MKNDKKLYEFLKAAVQYIGKEIELESNNLFRIDEVCYIEEVEGQNLFHIKYGTSIKGGIDLNYIHFDSKKSDTINGIAVYVKNKDGKMDILTSLEDINNNSKAVELIDNAIDDLNKAKVIGNYIPNVDSGSCLLRYSESVPTLKADKELKRTISKK